MNFRFRVSLLCFMLFALVPSEPARAEKNLVADPSFEEPKEKDRSGHVFAKWGGWIYQGECEFRVSNVSHSGKHSLLMVGGTGFLDALGLTDPSRARHAAE